MKNQSQPLVNKILGLTKNNQIIAKYTAESNQNSLITSSQANQTENGIRRSSDHQSVSIVYGVTWLGTGHKFST